MMSRRSISQRTRPSYGKNKYRGVNWNDRAGKWQVCIKVNGKNKYFGYFSDDLDGLTAVNKAYAKHFPNNPELQQIPYKEKLLNVNSIICGKW